MIDIDEICRLHFDELKSVTEIAESKNLNPKILWQLMRHHSLKPLVNQTRIRMLTERILTREFLEEQYFVHKRSTPEIARMTGLSRGCITNRMRAYGLDRRKRGFYSPSKEDHPGWKGVGKLPQSYVTRLRHGAKARNIEFKLSIEFLSRLLETQKYTCALSGIPIGFDGEWTASVDRKDSSVGYYEDNVWWVHKDVNLAKQSLATDRFVEICKAVARTSK